MSKELNLTTLEYLYTQVKSYEDKQWIGFLISREKRK